jgi:hypothetical protein
MRKQVKKCRRDRVTHACNAEPGEPTFQVAMERRSLRRALGRSPILLMCRFRWLTTSWLSICRAREGATPFVNKNRACYNNDSTVTGRWSLSLSRISTIEWSKQSEGGPINKRDGGVPTTT